MQRMLIMSKNIWVLLASAPFGLFGFENNPSADSVGGCCSVDLKQFS
jgi:hypothetical protein